MLVEIIASLIFSVHAQSTEPRVTVIEPKRLCSIDQFIVRKGKGSVKVCDKLKDKVPIDSTSSDSCKQRVAEKAKECLNAMPNVEQIAVKARFIEQFPVSQSSTRFTCELDKSGGSACP